MKRRIFHAVELLVIAASIACSIAFTGCKTASTAPDNGKLSIFSANQDTTFVRYGPVSFALSVLDASSYGVSGAYIDFYDPLQQRARQLGPTPIDGTVSFTDTVPSSLGGGTFPFAFTAQKPGSPSSDSLRLWLRSPNLRGWAIDSFGINSALAPGGDGFNIRWVRGPMDKGMDTIVVQIPDQSPYLQFVPYPQHSATLQDLTDLGVVDSFSIHSDSLATLPIAWAATSVATLIQLYDRSDSADNNFYGISLDQQSVVSMNQTYSEYQLADFVLVRDSTSPSGFSIVSASHTALSGVPNGRKTSFYRPVTFIDSTTNLEGLSEFYYSTSLSNWIQGFDALDRVPLPSDSEFSTAFIAITQDGNYAQVAIGPLTPNWMGHPFAIVEVSYQTTSGVPYAGRGHRK